MSVLVLSYFSFRLGQNEHNLICVAQEHCRTESNSFGQSKVALPSGILGTVLPR